jgi:hypothetical protein
VFSYETKSGVNFENSKVKLKSGKYRQMLNEKKLNVKEKCGIWLYIIIPLHQHGGLDPTRFATQTFLWFSYRIDHAF